MSVCFGGVVFCPKRGSFVFIGGSLTGSAKRRKGGAFAANRLSAHNRAPENGFRKDTRIVKSENPANPEIPGKSKSKKQKAKDYCANRAGKADKPEKPVKAATKSENKGEYKENEYGFL